MNHKVGFDPRQIDKVIHSPVRLAVVAALHASGEESFSNLRRIVGATDGNLTIHMKVLEDNGIIKVRKRFIRRRPHTSYRLTPKGRQVFREYVAFMAKVVDECSER